MPNLAAYLVASPRKREDEWHWLDDSRCRHSKHKELSVKTSDETSENNNGRSVSKLRRWIRRFLLGLLMLGVGVYVVLLLSFQISKHRTLSALESGSSVFESELGPIEYAIHGVGPVVLFVHGTPGGYDSLPQDEADEPKFRFLCPSRPGYLRTPITVGQSPAQQADALVLLLDGLEIEQVGVIGLSGGGPVAVELAKRHPTRVKCLVLYSALLGVDEDADASDASDVPIVDRFFGRGFAEWSIFTLVDFYPNLAIESDFLTKLERKTLLNDEAKVANLLDGMWKEFPSSVRREGYVNDVEQFKTLDLGPVENIQAPTLVVHGTEDAQCPFDEAESFVSRVPSAKSHWIEGGGHVIVLSHSDEIEPIITEFLSQHVEPQPAKN